MRRLAAICLVLLACTPAAQRPRPASPAAPAPDPTPAPDADATADPAPEPESPPPAPTPPPTLTISAVGDIMLGSTFPDKTGARLPPDDGANLLAEVAPILTASDIAFGNLEGPLIEGGTSWKCERMAAAKPKKKKRRKGKRRGRKQTCWAYRSPPRYAKLLVDAGFDVVSIANNHAMDFGQEGRDSTKAALDAHGIAHSGEPGSVARLDIEGRSVAVIAFSTADHSHNLNDIPGAVKTVQAADETADIVVVSFHGGAEGRRAQHVPDGPEVFYREQRGDLRKFTRAVVDAGADLVIGHGPHVVRGMEVYRGRLIAYSLGNFATYRGFNLKGPLGISLILDVTLAGDGSFQSGKIHPVVQPYPGGPVLDRERKVIPLLQGLCKKDFGDSAVTINDDGTLSAPN